MKSSVIVPSLLLLLLGFSGCETEQAKRIDELQKQVRDLTRELGQTASKQAEKIDIQQTLDEVKKIHQFEYGVFSFPAELSDEKLGEELGKLGKDRWDCFAEERFAQESLTRVRVFCKRHPESVLRYIPQSLAGGLLGLLH